MDMTQVRIIGILAIVFLMNACADTPVRPVYPNISFHHLKKIPMDVQTITSKISYIPKLDDEHIDALTPVSMTDLMADWAKQRIDGRGKVGNFDLNLINASITEVPLTIDKGVTGIFKDEQSVRYEARLEVEIKAVNPNSMKTASSLAKVEKSVTVSEKLTLNQRNQALYDLIHDMLMEMNKRLEEDIQTYFQTLLIK